ncbi:DUF3747 domain-containing protein [Acaryochloris sp. IP29b_bin.148]|uniref:DUF3747 domain-containing protein n=1 Tax=Acaryochloris sp. IP29b_bin.148 TaxID=2969218 RepID=UPI002628B39F|nr:DUF3747 domain-containing protein [Acaryochloris sp. IP29b_bin.148]
MKYDWRQVTIAIASMCFSLLIPSTAQAYNFGEQAVDQSKFIAIAVPFSGGKHYNLIILEQISASKSCWQDKADQPGVIDPLLLQFDFTGICGRSTDSNGYSIRQAGRDLALDYRLSIVRQKGRLVLMGYPLKNPQAPQLKIGQTQTHAAGFLKIELEPGWRFAKRTYNGKTLGHIYFTRDQVPTAEIDTTAKAPADTVTPLPVTDRSPDAIAEAPADAGPPPQASDPPESAATPLPPLQPLSDQAPDALPPSPSRTKDAVPLPQPKRVTPPSKPHDQHDRDELTNLITAPIEIPVPMPRPSHRSIPPTNPAQARRTLDGSPTSVSPSGASPSGASTAPSSATDSELPVLSGESPPPPLPMSPPMSPQSKRYHSPTQQPLRQGGTQEGGSQVRLAAQPPSTQGRWSRPIQIPVPLPQRPTSPTPALDTAPSTPSAQPPASGILPVPQGDAPLGRFSPAPDIYVASQDSSRASQLAAVAKTGNPPPPPLDAQSRHRYRVLVQVANTTHYKKIKTLVPDAFRSKYKGKSVLQVGAYETPTEANDRLDMLSLEGIKGILDIR